MAVTALLISLLIDVLFLLTVRGQNYVHEADAVFLHVVPNRLQFFEYEHILFNCTGRRRPTEWRVMRKSSSNTSRWETSTGCLNIQPAFVSHSGEYWCEDGEGRRSNSVNITIKGGGVILESPALPVMEQQNVTLRCRLKGTFSNLPADFIKDGHMNMVAYKGEMTIHNVSKSDDGLYKCRISGTGESAGSWLAVRAYMSLTPQVGQETSPPPHPPQPGSIQDYIPLLVVLAISCVAVLLLVVGILQCQKHKVACFSAVTPTTESERVSVYEHVDEDGPQIPTYAEVTKHRGRRGVPAANLVDVTYATIT
ncbi:low affinity immunoglobulin gamma Fc region receptor II-a-like [Larimichthys crocea]|uniref:low affinity immunoglobulin gamma Fc region receptor II-a-like n=1 Tax=Larimichthys crocea TaxID=215358 RepID=UPI000F5E1B88|nr:low affinity immunoglobulin gamma Fc region receptor II-a-like [Larimichthys crocea]